MRWRENAWDFWLCVLAIKWENFPLWNYNTQSLKWIGEVWFWLPLRVMPKKIYKHACVKSRISLSMQCHYDASDKTITSVITAIYTFLWTSHFPLPSFPYATKVTSLSGILFSISKLHFIISTISQVGGFNFIFTSPLMFCLYFIINSYMMHHKIVCFTFLHNVLICTLQIYYNVIFF